MKSFEDILFAVEGRVATLTLNRPATLNALTLNLMREVKEAVGIVDAERGIRALLITAAGKGFCSGQDLRNRIPDGADLLTTLLDTYYGAIEAIRESRVPVVTAINGTVAGGGFALALAGDIAIAARSAKFIQVFSRIGLIPDLGSTYVVPRAIGRARALRMMLTNDPISAQQAADWGMIAECVDDEQLAKRARELAERLADGPTTALAATRKMVDEGEHHDFRTQFRRELEVQALMRNTHDSQEGVTAFLEKRPARFRGD